ncbi:MAG: diguanylate cyclase [bacterium]|nr:diguanylate cyclase [bacterium]
MNTGELSYEELKKTLADLQKRVMRFSVVEQELINTRNSLDLELARFKDIHRYSQTALTATNVEDFYNITTEFVVDMFEVEIGGFFAVDIQKERLQICALCGYESSETCFSLDVMWATENDLLQAPGPGVILELSDVNHLWKNLELYQVIFAPYYRVDGELAGLIMGGCTENNKAFYDEISQALVPSFTVFSQQASALLNNIEAQTTIQRQMKKLRESEERLRIIFDTVQAGIVLIDAETRRLEFVNPAAAAMLKTTRERLEGNVCHDVLTYTKKGECPMLDDLQPVDNSRRLLKREDGSTLSVLKNAIIVLLDDRKYLLESFLDVSEIENARATIVESEEKYRSLEKISYQDPLTQLYNRRYVMDMLEREVERYRISGTIFSLLLVDLDNFKIINDTYGHLTGDDVLKKFACIITTITRESDICGRFGGEEFIIVLPNTKIEQAEYVAEKIRRDFAAHQFHYDSQVFFTTCTIGLASIKGALQEISSLINETDSALYRGKKSGKNQVVVH